jgi:hypothetical protein
MLPVKFINAERFFVANFITTIIACCDASFIFLFFIQQCVAVYPERSEGSLTYTFGISTEQSVEEPDNLIDEIIR